MKMKAVSIFTPQMHSQCMFGVQVLSVISMDRILGKARLRRVFVVGTIEIAHYLQTTWFCLVQSVGELQQAPGRFAVGSADSYTVFFTFKSEGMVLCRKWWIAHSRLELAVVPRECFRLLVTINVKMEHEMGKLIGQRQLKLKTTCLRMKKYIVCWGPDLRRS